MTFSGTPVLLRLDPVPSRTSDAAALAGDIQALVSRFSGECAQGIASKRTADELSALLDRARRFSVETM